jgi:uncharacterized membrane protein
MSEPSKIRTFRQIRRRGAVLDLIAILIVLIVAFVAFTTDSTYLTTVKQGLQETADSAALAAAPEIGKGLDAVRATVHRSAAGRVAGELPIIIDDEDIVVGFWDPNAWAFTPNATNANAVRVTAHVGDQRLYFAPVVGHRNMKMRAQAMAEFRQPGSENSGGKPQPTGARLIH